MADTVAEAVVGMPAALAAADTQVASAADTPDLAAMSEDMAAAIEVDLPPALTSRPALTMLIQGTVAAIRVTSARTVGVDM